MTVQRLEYQVRFVTPAFLGNAYQGAQWRTPPFKALLRQWWRIVHAPKVNFSVDPLWRDEGQLFGVAADGMGSRRSLVGLRLSEWSNGTIDQWQPDDRLTHPEVTSRKGEPMQIGAQLYLGYGPLTFGETQRRDQRGQVIKGTVLSSDPKRSAVADSDIRTLTISAPESHLNEITRAMALADWFGGLGSRSRNGWGSLEITAKPAPRIPDLTVDKLSGVLRPLEECLGVDWPHAIGSTNRGPLVWSTKPQQSWSGALKELARIKIAFRTGLSFDNVRAGEFGNRHFLGYPVTNHMVEAWGNQGRLANQILFKVRRSGNKWVGVIVHLPCRLPADLVPPQHNIDNRARQTWESVHAVLDREATRISA